MVRPSRVLKPLITANFLLIALSVIGLTLAGPARAFNYVADASGSWWGIQDDALPHVDTGSIRATQIGPGQSPTFSTSINGFGGLKVLVQTELEAGSTDLRFNGELMRGFGLQFDGVSRFTTTQSIGLAGVTISRSVYINTGANWGRWLDSFTNTTHSPLTIKVAFGGQSGIGTAPASRSSAIVNTSSGEGVVTAADAWVEVATTLAGTTMVGGPQVTIIGTPNTLANPFAGAITFAGNWLVDTFNNPLSYVGHEGNFQAYVNTITLEPGTTRSLLHFVVLGQRVNASTSDGARAAVEATATGLASAPVIGDLTTAEICSIDNFDVAALTANGFNYAVCTPTKKNREVLEVAQAPVPPEKNFPTPPEKYDVVGKTIAQLRADMGSGVTTSEKITQAYLDRIAAYDTGQFGFHSYEIVASNAIDQARAADASRKEAASRALPGLPIVGKNGLESATAVLPLTYLTDFGGAMARSVPDLADILNAVVAVDPADPETSAPGRHTPADWRTVLDPHALQGKRIGFIASAWVDPFGTTNTTSAEMAALQYFTSAGATIVPIGVTVGGTDTPPAPPAPPTDRGSAGWWRVIDSH